MNADQLLYIYNELQKIELRKNLDTFTLKELKKEIIKMKADTFAVTKMKRRQIIELIVQYHYLFSFPTFIDKTRFQRYQTN